MASMLGLLIGTPIGCDSLPEGWLQAEHCQTVTRLLTLLGVAPSQMGLQGSPRHVHFVHLLPASGPHQDASPSHPAAVWTVCCRYGGCIILGGPRSRSSSRGNAALLCQPVTYKAVHSALVGKLTTLGDNYL